MGFVTATIVQEALDELVTLINEGHVSIAIVDDESKGAAPIGEDGRGFIGQELGLTKSSRGDVPEKRLELLEDEYSETQPICSEEEALEFLEELSSRMLRDKV